MVEIHVKPNEIVHSTMFQFYFYHQSRFKQSNVALFLWEFLLKHGISKCFELPNRNAVQHCSVLTPVIVLLVRQCAVVLPVLELRREFSDVEGEETGLLTAGCAN